MYILNFCLRTFNYIDSGHELTMAEACVLTTKTLSVADETFSFDNPIFAKISKKLLHQTTMQDDSTTWKVLAYLHTLHQEVPRFDFHIKYDSKGHPEAICWMLPHIMRMAHESSPLWFYHFS
jgi:hypothetical protein